MKKLGKIAKEWIIAFCIAVIIAAIVFFICMPMRVEGTSMENTLYDGQVILVSRLAKYVDKINYKDIIIVSYTENNKTEKIVKRVIGKEGDHIQIYNQSVYVNSEKLDENYCVGGTEGNVDIFVPKDCYFILGDNRIVSKDSRYFGCISKKNIFGKVIKVIDK